MNRDRGITIALAVILLFACALAITVYYYPSPSNPLNNLSKTSPSQNTANTANQMALSAFLNKYGFENITNLAAFYSVPTNNEIILDCNYAINPQFYSVPPLLAAKNASAYSSYNKIIFEIGKFTICQLGGSAQQCNSAESSLYNFTSEYLNYTLISDMYGQVKQYIQSEYSEVISSPYSNLSTFAPVFYDMSLMNSSNTSEAYLISSMLNLKQVPQDILDLQNGTVVTDPFYVSVPFQFNLISYPLAPSCGLNLNIFNLVSNATSFSTQTYSSIYAGLNYTLTNICVNDSQNICTSNADKKLNFSFYVQS